MLFVECLKQHTKDRRLMHPLGVHDGDLWGCTPDVLGIVEEEREGYDFDEFDDEPVYECHVEPHPLYLGGRAPHYWICAYANNVSKVIRCAMMDACAAT